MRKLSLEELKAKQCGVGNEGCGPPSSVDKKSFSTLVVKGRLTLGSEEA